jgi:hypothetical protein
MMSSAVPGNGNVATGPVVGVTFAALGAFEAALTQAEAPNTTAARVKISNRLLFFMIYSL